MTQPIGTTSTGISIIPLQLANEYNQPMTNAEHIEADRMQHSQYIRHLHGDRYQRMYAQFFWQAANSHFKLTDY